MLSIPSIREATKRFFSTTVPDIIADIDNNFQLLLAALLQKTVVTVSLSADADFVATGTNDYTVINQAITYVNGLGGGIIRVAKGVYNTPGRIIPLPNVTVIGDGMGNTIFQGGNPSDYTILNTSAVDNFQLRDVTIDCQNATRASCARLYSATNCVFKRVYFKNVASGGWHLKLGVTNSATDGILNEDNKFIDCVFDGHAGTLEMLLLFNCRNTQVIRPKFRNKTTTGPMLGLWQKTYNTKIIDPDFKDCLGSCIYYSITCEGTWIVRPYAINCGTLIQGANVSDNGAFGLTQARNLKILQPVAIGGANSVTSTAIQLGALDDFVVDSPSIEKYQIGINLFKGNNTANAPATNGVIINPNIRDCNPQANFYTIHPGIYFSGIGGSLNLRVIGGNIYDDQATKTQRYPVSFDGAFTWDDISFINTRLSPDTANSGTPFTLQDGAAIGSYVTFKDIKGLNPNALYVQGSVTGATTFDRTNGDVITATLTGNLTTTFAAGQVKGDRLCLLLTQDATGSRTMTKPSNAICVGGAIALSTGANAIDQYEFIWNGTKWVERFRALNLS
jgi:hypothetical protein